MASITQVAKLAGVSIATVSRYINSPEQVKTKTGTKVAAAIAKTGYSPNSLAQNFRRGKTGNIVVFITSVGDPFLEGVMRGISQIAEEKKYNILIQETRSNTVSFDEYNKMVLSKQADGVILLAAICPFTAPIARPSESKQAPLIVACESVSEDLANLPSVRIDNESAAGEATDYLINLGHKDIAFIYGSSNSTLTLDRERGYKKAMKIAKLPIADDWIVEGGLSLAGARKATRKLLNHSTPPTAIFCANDEMAIACMHQIKTSGLSVPQDISVVGFDDIRYAEVQDPPLTTIAQPAEEIGERTILRLLKAIEGGDIGQNTEVVPHKLVIRQSAARPPKKRK
ncbi:MAG: LacI family DNA-binding transcriptional regulator [Pseudomonadales bacterium]